MNSFVRFLSKTYILFLTVVVGFSLFAGAVVAPVIFNSALFLSEPLLSRFQEGLLMTEVFVRLSYPLALLCVLSLVYEVYQFVTVKTDWWALLSMFVMVTTGLLFCFYFVPQIVELQSQGALVTQSGGFATLHKISEVSFKITVLSGIILIYRRLK
ncbi:DUF4149 domain-containing protein [Vibrio gallicus]|uniref:DUF4149 domain-containing protein n=1 Tax=Vibrio gallicus TaxID=190897 RepID=UPI0021C46075|nr:DUF4149 domain-containing protein [Vibrio gallicus]